MSDAFLCEDQCSLSHRTSRTDMCGAPVGDLGQERQVEGRADSVSGGGGERALVLLPGESARSHGVGLRGAGTNEWVSWCTAWY
eukprot:2350016-Rhodomonas_salina.4